MAFCNDELNRTKENYISKKEKTNADVRTKKFKQDISEKLEDAISVADPIVLKELYHALIQLNATSREHYMLFQDLANRVKQIINQNVQITDQNVEDINAMEDKWVIPLLQIMELYSNQVAPLYEVNIGKCYKLLFEKAKNITDPTILYELFEKHMASDTPESEILYSSLFSEKNEWHSIFDRTQINDKALKHIMNNLVEHALNNKYNCVETMRISSEAADKTEQRKLLDLALTQVAKIDSAEGLYTIIKNADKAGVLTNREFARALGEKLSLIEFKGAKDVVEFYNALESLNKIRLILVNGDEKDKQLAARIQSDITNKFSKAFDQNQRNIQGQHTDMLFAYVNAMYKYESSLSRNSSLYDAIKIALYIAIFLQSNE